MEDQVGDFLKQLAAKLELVLLSHKYNITCQSSVSHVQIQCTIAFDAQTEGKVSVRLNHDCHAVICRASLWSATATGNKEYTCPTNWWIIFMYFLEYCLKNLLLRYLVNPMQNQTRLIKRH